MLDPIKARVASSCSRKGIQLVVIDTTCCGETSIKSTLSGEVIIFSPRYLAFNPSSIILLFSSVLTVDWEITKSVSSSALKYTISSVITLSTTLRYGVRINP